MPVNRFFLRGIDYFQLLIDHHGKKKGGRGHEAHLSVLLEGHLDPTLIKKLIEEHELAKQLIQIRVSKTYGLGYPSIYNTKKDTELPIRFSHINSNAIPSAGFQYSINPYTDPPFFLQVFYLNNNTTSLLFTFHHILFDFTGVQSFIFSLAGMSNPSLMNAERNNQSFNKRIKGFFKEIYFTFKEANAAMLIPSAKLPQHKPFEITYRELLFNDEETSWISENAAANGIALNNSIYLLASCCMAMHQIILKNQKNNGFIWVPVPVNKRRKGGAPSILFNELTFLFYKLKSNELNDKKHVIGNIKDQMIHQMRNNMPDSFIDFVEGYKYMPMPFYYPMLNLPSWGKLSSFSFSVLGNTFENLDEFEGHKIIDIKNYPSNSISPGVTFLFYTYKNKLRLMSSWVKGQYPEDVQINVLEKIKAYLIKKDFN